MTISGRVKDPHTGLAVVGAEVVCYSLTTGARVASTVTDSDGDWVFYNLPDGQTYYVVVLYGGGRVVVDTGQQVISSAPGPGSVGTLQLQDGAVTGPKLAPQAVTTDKLADGAVTASKLANGAVGPNALAPGSVSDQHISGVAFHKVDGRYAVIFALGG